MAAAAAPAAAAPSPAASSSSGGVQSGNSAAMPSGGGGGIMTEVPDKAGWIYKFATGRSLLGRRNWKCRYLVSNVEGVAYYEKEPFVTPKGFVPWDRVTHLYPVINSAIDPAANDPDLSYFGFRFLDVDSAERMLLLRCENGTDRSQWVQQMTDMSAEADRIQALLDDDDVGTDGPTGRTSRRQCRARGAVLNQLQTRLRTMVSLKKQRFIRDGLNLDLAYVGKRIVAMGYPSTGREAMFRNPYTEVLDFFQRYHPKHYRVYNLCSERAYPPSRFDGRFARFPFDDHNPPPLALIPAFVSNASEFLDESDDNVVAIHCKAGKGRTGLMVCALLLARGDCANADSALEFFAKERTQDQKGVQIPSQIRFVRYFSQMLKHYSGNVPPAPDIIVTSITLSSTPRFDPDGGCDPFVVVSRRRADHRHVPLGTNEAIVSHPIEPILDTRRFAPPSHIVKQRDVRLPLRDALLPGGELRFEVFDQDLLSKNDIMMSFWVHTGFLPLSGVITFTKRELDDAVKDKHHELIDEDFVLTMRYRFATGGQNHAAAAAPAAQLPASTTLTAAAGSDAASSTAVVLKSDPAQPSSSPTTSGTAAAGSGAAAVAAKNPTTKTNIVEVNPDDL